ncbi:MAG: hypothetical protein ATN35_05810 [Epulopiscium sp. Nele67-Bin004]|nr:MAG: hypothetical protein ATN35_05810 [Epulopiscium sp. Nele67-Bin004]
MIDNSINSARSTYIPINYANFGATGNIATIDPEVLYDKNYSTNKSYDMFYQMEQYGAEEGSSTLPIDLDDVPMLISSGIDIETLPFEQYEFIQITDEAVDVDSENITQKVSRIKEQTDGMYSYAMQETGTITINSLYIGSFSQTSSSSSSVDKTDVAYVLGLNAIPNTSGNSWAAEKLMMIGQDVTPSNVTKMQNLQNAIDLMDLPQDGDDKEWNANKPIIEEEKVLYIEKDMQEIVDDLTEVDDSEIEDVIRNEKEVTIRGLRDKIMDRNTSYVKTKNVESAYRDQVSDIRGQINIIRAKLNVEAARNISQKMPLESAVLSDVANALVEYQNSVADKALEGAGLENTPEYKELMLKIMETTSQMKQNPDEALSIQMQTNETATLEEFNKVLGRYEENELVPERRFGESVAKVAGQINDYLKDNGLPTDELTVQAAKGLVMNNQELSVANIEGAKDIALKMTTFLEEMTPSMAAGMIKEGINPYNSNIDSSMEYIEDKRIPDLKKTVAESIVALDQKGQISSSQKQELIGLYQVLNGIEKNKEQVIGYMYKNDLPLTVERLQEAVKYANNSSNVAATVDDTTTQTEKQLDSSREKIETASLENKKLIDAANVVENTKLTVNRSSDAKAISAKLDSMIFPFVRARMKSQLGEFGKTDTLPDSFLEKINVAKNASEDTINALKDKGIQLTISNLYLMEKIIEDPSGFSENFKEYVGEDDYFPESLKELAEEMEALEKEAKEDKDAAMMGGDINAYKDNKSLEEMTKFTKQLNSTNGEDGVYQIPFVIQGEARTVHLYTNDKKNVSGEIKDELNAVISYNTKTMGTVVANLKITSTSVNYEVSGETEEITNRLAKGSGGLNQMIEEIGFKVQQGVYYPKEIYNPVVNPVQDGPALAKTGDSDFEEII